VPCLPEGARALPTLRSPLPRAALPKWTACQKVLWEVLKRLETDRAAIDAARVLRVVGTFHSETGVVVEALVPVGEVRGFEELAMEILPLDRAELRYLRVQRTLSDVRKSSGRLQAPPQGFPTRPPYGIHGAFSLGILYMNFRERLPSTRFVNKGKRKGRGPRIMVAS
jgi:hypothetical protein